MLGQPHFCKDSPVPGRKFISRHPQIEQMLSSGYNKTSAQSCEQLCNVFWHTENTKSLNASGRSPFFTIFSSFFEVFFPLIPAQTFFWRPVIKARFSYYPWRLVEAIQGFKNYFWMVGEGAKHRETQKFPFLATCHTLFFFL